ncbi:FlgD immunoglobulin-like domain containing protein [Candidatus Latescibacterota bacterium]
MKNNWKLLMLFLLYVIFSAWIGQADISAILEKRAGLGANDLNDLAWDGETIWVSGSGTLSNKIQGDGSEYTDWITYRDMPGFGEESISAFIASGDTLITAWIYNEVRNGEVYINGDGFSISLDSGDTWRHVNILDLFPERSDYQYPGTFTMTYDFSLTDGVLWCATSSGFLLKTEDLGMTWTNVLPDSGDFDFGNVNHHGYCADVYSDTLWVGTFKGVNASFDGGDTWTNFSWPEEDSENPLKVMPGNWVYTIEHKVANGKTHVWLSSDIEYNTGLGVYGICHTSDNGETWDYKTTDYNAWSIAFGHNDANNPAISDETVIVASDSGLVISYDLGETWQNINIIESEKKAWSRDSQLSGVLVVEDTLWVTSKDGIARSNDWGDTWEIYNQEPVIVQQYDMLPSDIEIHGNFPNPFNSSTTIEFRLKAEGYVKLNIFNISGQIINTLFAEYLSAGLHSVRWDGKDSRGSEVSAGIYIVNLQMGNTVASLRMVLMK